MKTEITIETARNGWIIKKRVTDYCDVYVFATWSELTDWLKRELVIKIEK